MWPPFKKDRVKLVKYNQVHDTIRDDPKPEQHLNLP